MGATDKAWKATAAVLASTVLVSCARPTPALEPAAATANPAQLAPRTRPRAIASLPPVGPYRPVTHPPMPMPTTLSPADLSALSPGAKALVTDYRSNKLSAYSFCEYAVGAFAPTGTIPARYHDLVLTDKDKIALMVTGQEAQTKLTPQQTAQLTSQLTSQLTRAVADH